MKAKKVKLEPQEEEDQEASVYGKRFGNAGGVTEAVVECLVESGEDTGINVMKCSGGAECKKALTLLKLGKLPADFIEGMACEGGCVNGPGKNKPVMKAKKDRDALIGQADDRKVIENLKHIDMESVNMHKH